MLSWRTQDWSINAVVRISLVESPWKCGRKPCVIGAPSAAERGEDRRSHIGAPVGSVAWALVPALHAAGDQVEA